MLVKSEKEITVNVPPTLCEETLHDFYAQLDQIIMQHPKRVYLNCGQLEYVNSRHIVTLWQAFGQCTDAGINVKLTQATVNLKQTLRLLDLHDLLLGEAAPIEHDKNKQKDIDRVLRPKILQMEFHANANDINDNLDNFRSYLNSLKINNLIVFELVTVFYEVTTNIRLHSDLQNNQLISFTASTANDAILLRFSDPGKKFNPIQKDIPYDPTSAIKEGRKRGLGLTLVKRIADSMKYIRENGKLNTFTLIKKVYQ
jgi:anti-sigma regulatory factor (Ser/Thr protein kinase)/anti-anti-sigma regulatory factor